MMKQWTMDEDDITLCFQVPRCVSIYFSFFCYWFNVNGWFVCEGLCLVAPQYCSANRTKKKKTTTTSSTDVFSKCCLECKCECE